MTKRNTHRVDFSKGSSAPVDPKQRFTADDPCPICEGHKDMESGAGIRCYGFRSSNGKGVVCTRIEGNKEAGTSGGWWHPLPSNAAPRDAPAAKISDKIEDVYAYTDESGRPLYEVVRFEGKRFKQRTPDGAWGIAGIRLVPYRLPVLIEAVDAGRTIYVVEGEKDVHSVESAGEVATCNSGGAGKWQSEFAEYLRGAHVVVVADKDDGAGMAHARDVRRSLLGVAASVQVVESAEGKDATDHLEAGHDLSDLVRVRTRFEQTMLGSHEVTPPTWLYEPIVLEGTHTTITSDAGTGKTIVALAVVKALVEQGDTVVYLDQENGPDVMSERLRSMGADMDAVDAHLAYFPYPHPGREEIDELVAEIVALDPALLVYDAKANFFASAGLDEDASMDATVWHVEAVQPLLRVGVAVVELDHSGHKDKKRARGSSAKGAVAEASWILTLKAKFDQQTVGEIRLERGEKNRRGALPTDVRIKIGGTPLVFEVVRGPSVIDDARAEAERRKRKDAVKEFEDALRAHGPLSQNKAEQFVRGVAKAVMRDLFLDATALPRGARVIDKVVGPRSATIYYLVGVHEDHERVAPHLPRGSAS